MDRISYSILMAIYSPLQIQADRDNLRVRMGMLGNGPENDPIQVNGVNPNASAYTLCVVRRFLFFY